MTVGRSVRLVVCLRQLYLLFSVRGRVYFCIECIMLLMCVFVLVVASFPRGCTYSRDRDLSFEVEFVSFLRRLRCMVQDADKIPAAYDHERLLSTRPVELGTLSQERYQALFVQYFRFDVRDQQRVFYRKIQLFLAKLCEDLVAEYQTDAEGRLNVTAFAPEAMFYRSKDRVVDALMDCCLLLTRLGSLGDVQGAKVVQQYNDVYSYFMHRWRSQSSSGPVVDDVISLWRAYPFWSRCSDLLCVFKVVVCCTTRSQYMADFLDVGSTALPQGQLLSSMNLVRSWTSSGVIGGARKLIAGFLRHCETTDMHVSRLMDPERGRPWDQLLKVGVEDVLARCYRVLNEGTVRPAGISVDEYRSAVCEQLKSGSDDAIGQLGGRSRNSASKGSALQFSVGDDEPLIRHVASGKRPTSQKDVSLPSTSRCVKGKKKSAGVKPKTVVPPKKSYKRKLTKVLMSESSEEY